MTASGPHTSPGIAAQRSIVGFGQPGFHRAERTGLVYLGSPLWWDDGYVSGSPQIVVVQAEPTAPAPQPSMHWEDTPKPQAPLLIERQGDRYVRVSGAASSDAAMASASQTATLEGPRTSAEANAAESSPASHSADLTPTVFVFRDGHRETSSNYSIIGATIYAGSDYWSNGAWTRKILVADLDLPATQQANQQRGVHFVLPSAPNEVVTRP